jgi:hypothetical protein
MSKKYFFEAITSISGVDNSVFQGINFRKGNFILRNNENRNEILTF